MLSEARKDRFSLRRLLTTNRESGKVRVRTIYTNVRSRMVLKLAIRTTSWTSPLGLILLCRDNWLLLSLRLGLGGFVNNFGRSLGFFEFVVFFRVDADGRLG